MDLKWSQNDSRGSFLSCWLSVGSKGGTPVSKHTFKGCHLGSFWHQNRSKNSCQNEAMFWICFRTFLETKMMQNLYIFDKCEHGNGCGTFLVREVVLSENTNIYYVFEWFYRFELVEKTVLRLIFKQKRCQKTNPQNRSYFGARILHFGFNFGPKNVPKSEPKFVLFLDSVKKGAT